MPVNEELAAADAISAIQDGHMDEWDVQLEHLNLKHEVGRLRRWVGDPDAYAREFAYNELTTEERAKIKRIQLRREREELERELKLLSRSLIMEPEVYEAEKRRLRDLLAEED